MAAGAPLVEEGRAAALGIPLKEGGLAPLTAAPPQRQPDDQADDDGEDDPSPLRGYPIDLTPSKGVERRPSDLRALYPTPYVHLLSANETVAAPSAGTATDTACALSFSCQTLTVCVPAGTPSILNFPSGPVLAK